eukprot:TRINITY_DN19281_c0_g1_i1.p1 TRINITY_DN19281_c0_g1~~TRINITY_DN19281_c0_g1_i1.p1  ORF type:complete len:632 (+),score=84.76 TRINITY_DN19281_c0_g1_i1:36-1931(+)
MECETTRNFTTSVDALVKDRLRLPAEEAGVTGDHNQLSTMLKGMEAVLSKGTYQGSSWWECMNHVLQVMVEEGDGVPPGLQSNLGDNIQDARGWLLHAIGLMNSLEEFITRCFSMEDVVSAYYVSTSPLGHAETRKRILRAFTKLTSLSFFLVPSDIRLFTCVELQVLQAPDSPRNTSSPVVVRKRTIRTRTKKKTSAATKNEESESSPAVVTKPVPPVSPVREVILDKTEYIMVSDESSQTREISRREVESRHTVVQRGEMRLVQHQLDLKSHESRIKDIEAQNAKRKAYSESLLTAKEILFALKDFSQIKNTTNVTLEELSRRIPAIITAVNQKVTTVPTQAPLSPRALSSAVLGKAFSSHFDLNMESTRARSCAFSPTKDAQVLTGQGIDALEHIQDDFFKVDSDDEQGIAVSQFRGSFRPGSWLTFEGISVDEIASVKREMQITLQSHQCAGCKGTISASKNPIRRARLCHYSGKYFCRSCHKKKTHVLPSLIIKRWDFSQKQVCDSAHWHLRREYKSPVLNLSELNSNLYSKLDSLQSSRRYRTAIVNVAKLLPPRDCQLTGSMSEYQHYLTNVHTYSLADLVAVHESEDKFIVHLKSILGEVVMKAEKIDATEARNAMRQAGVTL